MKNGTCARCVRLLNDQDSRAPLNDDLVLSPSQAPPHDASEAASEVTSLKASTLFANNGANGNGGFRQMI